MSPVLAGRRGAGHNGALRVPPTPAVAHPFPRLPLGGRALSLLLGGLLAAGAASQAFAESPVLARNPFAAAPAPGPANPLVRVLLLQAGVVEPRALAGPLRLLDEQGRELLLLPAGERLRISREGLLLRLERPDSSDPLAAAPLRLPLQVVSLEPAPPALSLVAGAGSGLVGLGRRAYRGALQLRPEGGSLMALNRIPLELYLPSVVGSEMPARWPAAALEAQAVAARTYALAQIRPAAPYDLKATVASQAYLGVEAETDSTRAAVAATRALVLRHGGALIDAVFHSSSGGSTENSGELWNRQMPYLVSVPDRDDQSPWREWTLRFEPEQLRRAFRETDGANRIEVLAASSTGRVRMARVIGPAGSLDLSGSELRQRLGLRSTLVRFRFEQPLAPGPVGGITTATARANAEAAALNRYGGRGADAQPRTARSWLRSGNGASADSSATGWPAAGSAASGPPPPPPLPGGDQQVGRLALATTSGVEPPSSAQLSQEPLAAPLPSLEVVGRGFGHGVGMSQWGAYGLALRGKDYGAILRYYYRGAELAPYARP